MASDVALTVKIASGGAAQTIRDVAKLQKAIAQLGKDSADTRATAAALGKAFNLPDDQVRDLARALAQARKEAAGFSSSASNLDLSSVLGISAKAAQDLAKSLGLTQEETLSALAVINELNEGNVSASEQYALLSEQLGVTSAQFEQLSQTAERSRGRLSSVFSGDVQGQVSGLGNRFSFLLKTILAFGAAVGTFKLIDKALTATGRSWIDVGVAIGFSRDALEGFVFDFKLGNTAIQKGLEGIKSRAQAFVQTLKNVSSGLKDFGGQALFGGRSGLGGFAELLERLSIGFSVFTLGKQLLGGFGQEVDQASQKTGRFSGLLQGLAAGASFAVINQLTESFRRLGQAITSTIGSSIQLAGEFEASVAAASTLTNDTDGLVTALEAAQKRLGGQVTTAELVASSYDILSSGFTDSADAANIAEQAARGAIAGFSDAGIVADALTSILNSYGKSSSEAATIVDQLVKTQDLGKITIDEYAQQVGRAASIAAQAGVSFEEFSAAVATATVAGVPAETAVSGVRQAIINLIKPTNQAVEQLEEFGITNVQAVLASEGLIGVLDRLGQQGATSEQLSLIFSDVDALTAIAPLAGENVSKFGDALAQIEGAAGSADVAIDKITDTLPNLQRQLSVTAQEGLRKFGEALEPTVTAVLGFVQNTLSSLGEGANVFGPLILAGEALSTAFQRNSQLIDIVAESLSQLASIAVNQVAGAITNLANFIESTPGSFARFGESLTEVAIIAADLASTFGSIALAVGGTALDAFQDLLPALGVAAAVLQAVAQAVKVLVVDTGALNVVLKVLVLRFLAVQAIALGQVLVGIAGAMGTLIAVTKIATVTLSAFGVSVTAALGPLALLAAAVAAVNFAKFVRELKVANDELAAYTLGLNTSTEQGFQFANKLNNLNDAITEAGGRATAEQTKQLAEYVRLSKEQISALEQQLSEVQSFEPKNDPQRQAQQNLTQQLQTTINSLNNQISEAEGTLSAAAAGAGDATGQGFQEGLSGGISDAVGAEVEEAISELDKLATANNTALDDITTDTANAKADLLEGGGTQAEVAALEKKALEDRVAQNRTYLQQLKDLQAAGGLSTEEAQAVADAIRQVEGELANDRVTLAQQTLDAQREAAREAAEAAEEAAKAQADALKETREEAKRLAEESFGDAQREEGVIFSDAQAAKAEAFQEAQQADQEAFNASQQGAAKEFQKGQQAEAQAFQQMQQASAKAFQEKLDAERDQGNREFDVLTDEVERRVQLQQAATEEEQKALREKFRLEDEQLKKRREIEAQVLRERGQILSERQEETQLGPLEQARADFEAQLQARAEAFQNTQQANAQLFQAEQQAAAEAFEAKQQEAERIFQEGQEAESKAFRDAQKEEDRAFQAEQQEAERVFNEQQRQLDKANAEQIARILEAAKPRGIDGARRDGGPVRAGGTYLVGEEGPELVTPRRGGYVYTAQQTAALMAQLPTLRGVSVPAVGSTAKLEKQMDALIQEVRKGRTVRPQTTYNLATPAPVQDAMALQLAEIRALMDRRGL